MTSRAEDFLERARVSSLRAYERGRMKMALVHALTFCFVGAGLSLAFVGARSLVWLPLTFVAWALLEWRGVGLLRGGRVGALAGVVTLALPMSLLRRCCRPGAVEVMGMDCCSMPGTCAAAGVLVGLVLAFLLPTKGSRREAALGMVLGVVAVAPMKCTGLLLGEAVGLVGGLVAGALVASAARMALARRTATA